mmetsp:Transcript_17572/g.42888  ORF Transcript_17572/g.42888 Transcript_17572/m.42888 type:complete len:87 (-) Transcript_17572:231-491(-)
MFFNNINAPTDKQITLKTSAYTTFLSFKFNCFHRESEKAKKVMSEVNVIPIAAGRLWRCTNSPNHRLAPSDPNITARCWSTTTRLL